MIRNAGGSVADWKDIYRLLVTSLRASSVHFQQLSFDSITVGLWGLSKAHAAAEPALLPGHVVLPTERSVVTDWIYWADLLLRTFDGTATTAAALASSLDSQDLSVLHFEPTSAPLLPAHAVLADHGRKQLLLLVRGTSSWADCLTDIVAHTQPLGTGHVHSGMLDCARSVLDHCMPFLQQQLQDTPGYRIHCLGHSLGGGVAALAALLLRSTPELKQQLQGASGVMATGFGTPPVMTQDLSDAAASFTRTLVHDWDLVPRTCVASLALLRSELEAQKDAVYNSSSLLSSLKSSGVLEGGASLLGSVATAAIASKLIPGGGSAAKGRWLAAGLQVGGAMLLNTAKQMHQDIMTTPVAAPTTAVLAPNPPAATAAAAAAAAGRGSAGTTLTAAAGSSGSSNASGAFSFASMRQAVAAAATAAAAAGGRPAQADGGSLQKQPTQPPPVQQQQQQGCGADAFRSPEAAQQSEQERYQEEEQAAKVCLYCPGQLWHLRRCTGLCAEGSCTYELLRAEQPGPGRFGGKIWVQRSMLSDHYLSTHMLGLLQLQGQLVQQAAGE